MKTIIAVLLLSTALYAQEPSALMSNVPSRPVPPRGLSVLYVSGFPVFIDWYDFWQNWICSQIGYCREVR